MWYHHFDGTVVTNGQSREGNRIMEDEAGERLRTWLKEELDRTSYRSIEARTGVTHGTLERIIKGRQGVPELETLDKLASGLGRPLADVVEMAGFSLGLAGEDDELMSRLRAQSLGDPLLGEILALLRDVSMEERRGVLAYLRGSRARQRGERADGA
jgi:transcriptional regulator with XRE-family HTH domain